jgi:hypothetical protein
MPELSMPTNTISWSASMGARALPNAAFIAHAATAGYLHVAEQCSLTLGQPLDMLPALTGTGEILGTFQAGGTTTVMVAQAGLLTQVTHWDYDCDLQVTVAGADGLAVGAEIDRVLAMFPTLTPITADEQSMRATYWFATSYGPRTFSGLLPRMSWSDIAENYSDMPRDDNPDGLSCRKAFGQLIGMQAPEADAGRVLLLTGPPGTGKSRLITAMANEWAGWADLHVVSDPAEFFENREYLMSVAERFTDGQAGVPAEVGAAGRSERWGVMVFEDADKYIDARQLRDGSRGDGISSLLNMADGMLGVSMRVLFVLTSNVATEHIDQALTRPGRCMGNIHVPNLSQAEAVAWLANRDHAGDPIGEDGASLASLYDKIRPATSQAITASAKGDSMSTKTILRVTSPARFTVDPKMAPIVASGADGQAEVVPLYNYPLQPPREFFTKKKYSEPTPKTVNLQTGQISGHIWSWDKPHIGYNGRAVYAPRSRTGYSEFLIPHTMLDDGTQIRTGPIYLDCDHAPLEYGAAQARDTMAHTGCAWASVVIYEDEFGGQVQGCVLARTSPALVQLASAVDISPDWREAPRGRGHEMVGLVSVNTSGLQSAGGGYGAMVASGRQHLGDGTPRMLWNHETDEPMTIVAVGMIRRQPADEVRELRAEVARLSAFLVDQRADKVLASPSVAAALAEDDDARRARVLALIGDD